MLRSVRNYASVGRWLFRSRFFTVLPTPFADKDVAPTRSAVSPVIPLYPTSPRCPSHMPKRIDAKTTLCWTGAMQLRGLHAASEGHQEVDDFLHKRIRLPKTPADFFNTMEHLMRTRSYSDIPYFFKKMKTDAIPIDRKTYITVMKAYSRMSNVDMVKQLFDEAVTSGMKLNKYMFNTLIYAYANTGDVHAAFEILDQMQKDYKIPPDHATYRSLISVCNKGRDVDRARETFDEMVQKFGDVVRGFNGMMEVYAENADSDTGEAYLEECKKLMASIKSKQIKPQTFTYLPLITLSGKLGRRDEALGYLKESVGSEVEEPNLASFDYILQSLVDLELTDEEVEKHIVYCLDRMKELGLWPTHLTFEGILQLYEKKGDLNKALRFLNKLPTKNRDDIGRNGGTFAAQFDAIQRLWESGAYTQEEALTKVSEVVEKMRSLRVFLTNRGYKTWFTMCLKASDVELAHECWHDFTGQDRWPSVGMTESLIRLLLDDDRLDDAVQVMKKAVQRNRKIAPDQGAYEAVLAQCAAKGDAKNAKIVYKYMKKARVRPSRTVYKYLRALELD